MPAWTPARQAKVRRRKDGKFGPWVGGKPDTRNSSFAGNYIHLSHQFKKQDGRAAKVGDVTRQINADGTYHKQSMWYIRTPHGWRRSKTQFKKPTKAQIRAQIKTSRPRR